jgi:glycosyltransferase involved in cell wall biosynthesis
VALRTKPRAALVHARAFSRRAVAPLRTELDRLASREDGADLALFHDDASPPSGGGNQFLRALVGELESRRLTVERNRISGTTRACLFNSFNFDFRRLRRFARDDVRLVHRVDGPIADYRGYEDGTDRRILRINHELASATVFQSQWSLDRHGELGLGLRSPTVIPNAVDPAIFHPPVRREPLEGRRVRLVATSWSSNPRKGADALGWLDRHLDHERFELVFVGRPPVRLDRIRAVGPFDSDGVADALRRSDLYLAASRDDPCSNALLEALACGLPAAFLRSGGHPELVGEAGLGFDRPEELPDILEQLAGEVEHRRNAIRLLSLSTVADRYLEILRS